MRQLLENVTEDLLSELVKHRIKASIVSIAKTGSIYIKFKEQRMGKIRIGGHNKRKRYGYKWQLRTDINEAFEDYDKGHRRFFFPITQYKKAVDRMVSYHNSIKAADTLKIKRRRKNGPNNSK